MIARMCFSTVESSTGTENRDREFELWPIIIRLNKKGLFMVIYYLCLSMKSAPPPARLRACVRVCIFVNAYICASQSVCLSISLSRRQAG